jgi:GWxTD domain-containing protein
MEKAFIILTVFFLMILCSVQAKKLSKTDVAELYNESGFTSFDAVIYHQQKEYSTVFMNVRLNDFIYLPEGVDSINIARFSVFYLIYDSWESKSPIDSASFIFIDSLNFGEETEMIIDFDVKTSEQGSCLLKIALTDLQRPKNHTILKFLNFDRSNPYGAQNFLVKDDKGFTVFNNVVQNGQTFQILYNRKDTVDLVVRYYKKQFPLAKPPFVTDKYVTYNFEPDSMFRVSLTAGLSELLELPFPGIYHFQADVSRPEGLTIFRFEEGFPEISSPYEALLPLRYLTTQKEYDMLLTADDYKITIDSFWLERASENHGRAKNMIQRFYTRVGTANRLFTSYHEGWKTDMGLIYIIYGPPSEVFKSDQEEEWIYGERGNPLSIRFYFQKVINPFTVNDYLLHRSSLYNTSWYIAVETWRR